jgi:hypothetical protein
VVGLPSFVLEDLCGRFNTLEPLCSFCAGIFIRMIPQLFNEISRLSSFAGNDPFDLLKILTRFSTFSGS